MDLELRRRLEAQVSAGGHAYLRNLAAAEAAVLRGQFNVAKVLRALAHSQRVQAMNAARILAYESDPSYLFQTVLAELDDSPGYGKHNLDSEARAKLERSIEVRKRVKDVLLRAIASLEVHADVMESDVAQSLWGCYGCGYIAEGVLPDACPLCEALAPEFQWFGPFYANTPEHLGQLAPSDIVAILETAPDEVAAVISGVTEEALRRKPSEGEWCAKEVVGHMLETDLLFARRVRTVLEEQGTPNVDTPVPPWKLQEGKGYEDMSADQLLARLRDARSTTLKLVGDLTPQQWARRGMVRGSSVTLIDLGTWLANHDRGHLAQLRRG